MWRHPLSVIVLLCLSACGDNDSAQVREFEFRATDTTIVSRGVDVPVTLVVPVATESQRYPLVVMAHGHGGSRHEGGGYQLAAESLAKAGIASIRMDFPGCGDSSESFTENNLSNMLLDLQAGRSFAEARPEIDSNRVGVLGYSMGGRLAVLLADIDPTYKVMAAWTPAVADDSRKELTSLGGSEYYDSLKQKALETGVAEYTTRWGTTLQLGYRWFIDLEESNPLGSIAKFEGPLLVLYGDEDDVVPPATSEAAIAAATSSSEVIRHVIPTANHALGFYTNRPEVAAEVVSTTVEFFQQRL
jgi:dienelactone hydrolase